MINVTVTAERSHDRGPFLRLRSRPLDADERAGFTLRMTMADLDRIVALAGRAGWNWQARHPRPFIEPAPEPGPDVDTLGEVDLHDGALAARLLRVHSHAAGPWPQTLDEFARWHERWTRTHRSWLLLEIRPRHPDAYLRAQESSIVLDFAALDALAELAERHGWRRLRAPC